jgi:hypothetical protein
VRAESGVHLNPPDDTPPLCVDGLSGVRALLYTQSLLTTDLGYVARMPRNNTSNGSMLVATMNLANENKIARRKAPRELQELLRSAHDVNPSVRPQIDVTLSARNFGTHLRTRITTRPTQPCCPQRHRTCIYASWFNQLECGLRTIAKHASRGGPVDSATDLTRNIDDHYLHGDQPGAGTPTATADSTLAELKRLCTFNSRVSP